MSLWALAADSGQWHPPISRVGCTRQEHPPPCRQLLLTARARQLLLTARARVEGKG